MSSPTLPDHALQKTHDALGFDIEAEKASNEMIERIPSVDETNDIGPAPTLSKAEQRRLYWKIDMRLLPILILMELCSSMDRSNIGNAKIQGLTTQLDLTGSRYNNALALYFLSYILLECPSSLVMKKFRPSRWLPGITIAWGVIIALQGLVTNYSQLVGVRVALGAMEAGIFPGACWYLSMWYPRHALQYRIALFWGGATIAGAFSGALAFAISFMAGVGGKEGWSWIFIIEGIVTVVVGVAALFILVDFPSTASFLTPRERAYVVYRTKFDGSSVGEQEQFRWRYVLAAFLDWKTWTHALMFVSLVGPLYGISFFLPSIINNFGFSAARSQLLSVPPYVFAALLGVGVALLSDARALRWPCVLLGHALCLAGFAVQISDAHFAVKYVGTFACVGGSFGVFPAIASWISNNTAGQYKRGTAIAINVAFGNFAGSIGSILYTAEDAPRYILGNAIELIFVGLGMLSLAVTVFAYSRINARREREMARLKEQGIEYDADAFREMGDRAPSFKYTL
ncbi:MFS general substrate transporter [Phanerochaete sordida]|uniref:MFS general substrate transporter n=1 Tax=Phanerochaete sordida TaxID=48140 RepID=A0A9P3GK14_9APHY|nr:MFS general substrate transporter [Phanerochaete sordida]